jgi:hypothetical protein
MPAHMCTCTAYQYIAESLYNTQHPCQLCWLHSKPSSAQSECGLAAGRSVVPFCRSGAMPAAFCALVPAFTVASFASACGFDVSVSATFCTPGAESVMLFASPELAVVSTDRVGACTGPETVSKLDATPSAARGGGVSMGPTTAGAPSVASFAAGAMTCRVHNGYWNEAELLH